MESKQQQAKLQKKAMKEHQKKLKRSRFQYNPPKKSKQASAGPKIDPKCQEATPEILRIEIDQIFKDFLDQTTETEYIFPSTLNNLQRKYIHAKAQALNLTSKSYGREPDRQLHIKKKNKMLSNQSYYILPSDTTEVALKEFFLLSFPQERLDHPPSPKLRKNVSHGGKLVNSRPRIPRAPHCASEFTKIRQSLPIWEYREEIVRAIRNNRITIISSETGSGKTTQVPQYILDDALANKEHCKIICTQPRRISTVSSTERVCCERGDVIGGSVGYHIKLEQKYGTHTNLIYCTTGVLVRNLMSCGNEFLNATHIILDEVHERDKLVDFLLICLKQYVEKYPKLKIILMSATVDAEKFRDYFESGHCLSIPGRLFAIEAIFLEQILYLTKYKSAKMREAEINAEKKKELVKIGVFGEDSPESVSENEEESQDDLPYMNEALDDYQNFCDNYDYKIHYEEATAQLEMYFLSEGISVDFQHTETGKTALMIATHLGDKEFISRLCNMGANMELRDKTDKSVFDYASNNPDILHLLNFIKDRRETKSTREGVNAEAERLLELYDKTTPDDFIDFDLIVTLILFISNSNQKGSILVFLPGYDDIMICNDRICRSTLLPDQYRIFFLHGSMNIKDQHDVFRNCGNKRKIILSTNIAETSITIDDVVFVIDAGKAKEKCYDSYNKVSSLQTRWISKACAKQRMGRAGRTQPGMCFRLYSQQRYENMEPERIPEILRVSLEELCLHSKILAPDGMNIHDFLVKAPDPPSANSIKVAIENLQFLGALDKEEDLTVLGDYLAQLTVEPHLGKMLIFGVIFKCLEPILTLVASMTHKDPFQLPPQANLKTQAAEKRKELLYGVMSDHLLYLEVFRKWQVASCEGSVYKFCEEYFISQPTMNSILETRSQQLAQLRALNLVDQSNCLDAYNVHANCWPMVKAVMCTGLYPNLSYPRNGHLGTRSEKKVNIQHNSACGNRPINTWLMYDEMIKHKNNLLIRGVTAVTPLTVTLVCGNDSLYPSSNSVSIDDWLEFELPSPYSCHLRKTIQYIIASVLTIPTYTYTAHDLEILNTLKLVLESEEKIAELIVAENVGAKPKFFFPQNDIVIFKHKSKSAGSSSSYTRNGVQRNLQSSFDAVSNNSAGQSRSTFRRTPRKPVRNSPDLPPNSGTYKPPPPPPNPDLCDSMADLDLTSVLSSADRLLNGILSTSQAENSANGYGLNGEHAANGYGLSGERTANGYGHNGERTANGYGLQRKPSANGYGLNGEHCYANGYGLNGEHTANGYDVNGENTANGYASNGEIDGCLVNKYENYKDKRIFILIKPRQLKNIHIAYQSSKWIFAPQTEKKVLHYHGLRKQVFLVFSVLHSYSFQGIAKFLNIHNFTATKPTASIEWIFTSPVPFSQVRFLKNPYNNDKPLYEGLDGQVIQEDVGQELYNAFSYYEETPNWRAPRASLTSRLPSWNHRYPRRQVQDSGYDRSSNFF